MFLVKSTLQGKNQKNQPNDNSAKPRSINFALKKKTKRRGTVNLRYPRGYVESLALKINTPNATVKENPMSRMHCTH